MLYRIRWSEKPEAVVEIDGGVRVGGMGPKLVEVASEAAVNGADAGSWFFDAAAKRLIVRAGPSVPSPVVEAPPRAPQCGCASVPEVALWLACLLVISRSATRWRKARGFVGGESK